MVWDEAYILGRLNQVIRAPNFSGPVAEPEIAGAEEALHVRFPTSYRIFLKHFGAAWLPSSFELAGLCLARCTDREPPLWSHVIDVTERMRRASRGRIPKDYLRVSDDGGDFAFYLDTGNTDARGESPVVVLGPGRDSIILAHSFLEFVELASSGKLAF
jgi:hypothetical protein